MIFKLSIILLLSFGVTVASAAEKKRKSSGASSMGGKSTMACFRNAVEGTPDCAQRADEPVCLGLKKSLENSRRKTDCLRRSGSECLEWGHSEKTQSQWMSIAAYHLSEFGLCVKQKYGSDSSNGRREAMQDPGFLSFLEQLDDGSIDYMLNRQEILLRTLKGERFSAILKDSAVQTKMDPLIFHGLLTASDHPVSIKKEELAQEDELLVPSRTGKQKRIGIDTQGTATTFVSNSQEQTELEKNSRTPQLASEENEPSLEIQPSEKKSMMAAAPSKLRQRSPYSLGLDLSIFDRVSIAYGRKENELKGIDQFLTENPSAPPKDIREALRRGGGL